MINQYTQSISHNVFKAAITVGFLLLVMLYAPITTNAQSTQLKCGSNFDLEGNKSCATTQQSCLDHYKKLPGSHPTQTEKDECASIGDSGAKINSTLQTVVDVLSAIVGVVAVIMVIIGGFKYITSAGDAAKAASARSTIVYAIVGLIIVALAQVIVRFVLSKV